MGETANTTAQDAPAAKAAGVALQRKPIPIYLNKSIDFATVHGDRVPGDRDHAICFMQHGLPFDAQERLIEDHEIIRGDPKAAAKIEKLRNRAMKVAERQAMREAGVEDEESVPELDGEDDGEGVVDLKRWAMGVTKYRWQIVSDAMVMKFQRRFTSKRDALETLVQEGVVQPGQLSAEHRLAMQQL